MANFDLKILCVDDEEAILELYENAVKAAGFTPIVCSSAPTAVRRFREEMHEILLVLSDFQMPEMTGFDFRRTLLPEGLAVPFVIVSSFVTKEMALEALDLKVDAFFDKPVDEDCIRRIIEKYGKSRIETIRENQALESTFIDEALTIIDELDSVLLSLDCDRLNQEKLNLVFRGAHTIKGSSGILSSDIITRYVHKYEDIISAVKKGELEFDDIVYEVLLKGFDRIKELINSVSIKTLHTFRLNEMLPELEIDQKRMPTDGVFLGGTSHRQIQSQTQSQTPNPALQQPKENISVPIEMLDRLSSCSGEITVIRNMVNKLVRSLERQHIGNKDVQNLGELLDEMHKINSTIQSNIVDLRKIPLSGVLKPIPRIVRDIAKELGKSINLKIEGEKLRVDNSLAMVCSNSLVHLVRNSADHGIEDMATRKAVGKSEVGNITITCRELSEEVQIAISDDGRGIDSQKIRQKALEKSLFTAQQLDEMSEQQTLGIIFSSGFSTAAQVTDVSGRGVGMDMVRSSVNAVGGQIIIDSEPGKGSTFNLNLPIPKSVLIITSLLVDAGGHSFAVPQDSIQKVLRIESEKFSAMVQMASLGRVLRCDGEIFPLLKLSEVLCLDGDVNIQGSVATYPSTVGVLVLETDRFRFALEVDGIHDAEEIVVKRIQSCFNPQGAFTGATFMGDGTIGLILDVKGIANLGGIKPQASLLESMTSNQHATTEGLTNPNNERNFLLFKLRSKALFGVPLEQVFRLEEFDSSKIQRSGAERVIIYRDGVMPLFSFEKLLNLNLKDSSASLGVPSDMRIPAIVAQSSRGYLALQIESVVDIAAASEEVSPSIRDRKGVVGNAYIREHNVTILDLPTVLGYPLSS